MQSKKFVSSKTIPQEFFRKNVTLYGKVEQVKKFDGTEQSIVVFVDHTPIFNRSRRRNNTNDISYHKQCLKITIPGIMLKSNYYPDLYKKLMSKTVAFTLLEADETMNSATSLLYVRTIMFKVSNKERNVMYYSQRLLFINKK